MPRRNVETRRPGTPLTSRPGRRFSPRPTEPVAADWLDHVAPSASGSLTAPSRSSVHAGL